MKKAALLALILASSALAQGPADQILAKADSIRNPAQSYFMKVTVKSGADLSEESAFQVSIQGNTRTLIKTLAPARDRGRNMLMLEEDMWAFIPNLKRAVRIGLNQKLVGQAANGDISRMRWSGDYAAQIESETAGEWVLFLTARKKGLTYEKIRVWVEKKTFRPKKAQFLTLAGKPLKNAAYEGYRLLAGQERPGQIRIQDAVRPDDKSIIQIDEMTVRSFPASLFNQNSLSQ